MARNGLTVLVNRWSRVDSTGEAREAMVRVRARVRVFMDGGWGLLSKISGLRAGCNGRMGVGEGREKQKGLIGEIRPLD